MDGKRPCGNDNNCIQIHVLVSLRTNSVQLKELAFSNHTLSKRNCQISPTDRRDQNQQVKLRGLLYNNALLILFLILLHQRWLEGPTCQKHHQVQTSCASYARGNACNMVPRVMQDMCSQELHHCCVLRVLLITTNQKLVSKQIHSYKIKKSERNQGSTLNQCV